MKRRPYPPTNLNTALWMEIEPECVSVKDIIPTQKGVLISGIKRLLKGKTSFCGDVYIHVVSYNGHLYLEDGHHRFVVALARGDKKILARVLR